MVIFKETTDLDSPIYQDALQIRTAVFVQEQNVAASEEIVDEDGPIYFVGYIDETAVVTARAFEEQPGVWHIQRVAVKKQYRHQQLGSQLMEYVEKSACHQQIQTLTLGAQDQAQPFYLKLGYHVHGAGFLDAGIKHHQMDKVIKKDL